MTAHQGELEPVAASSLSLPNNELMTDTERRYLAAARAPNTLRGYRSDWAEFTSWCADNGADALPASAATITGYLTMLADTGAKVGTLSRRLSSIKFAHRTANLPDPTDNARVLTVWEGIRRTHAAPPEQAKPLMPPELWDTMDACPHTKIWKTRGRPPEPDLAGLRDRTLLLVGFVGALRRSEISALNVADIAEHPAGLVLSLPRSKTNQRGEHAELVVLPHGSNPTRSPVHLLTPWIQAAGITDGPLFRPVSKGNRVLSRRIGQRHRATRHHPCRPSYKQPHRTAARPTGKLLQRPQSPCRIRHLRAHPRLNGPSHRPPNPTPLPRLRRHLHPHPHRLGRQRRHPTRPLTAVNAAHRDASHKSVPRTKSGTPL